MLGRHYLAGVALAFLALLLIPSQASALIVRTYEDPSPNAASVDDPFYDDDDDPYDG